VIEFDPAHCQAYVYRTLAHKIEKNGMQVIPKPMDTNQLEKLLIEHGLAG
jgi:nitrogenase iron protein NifH